MPPPDLSVAMAVHNGARFVERSVRSILAQTFEDFEFIIGDDGSNDETGAILARLAAEDRRITILQRTERSGVAKSANWVVGESSAPLVAIAHADDLAHPERLAAEIDVLRKRPDCVLVGALGEIIDEEGRRVRPSPAWRLKAGQSLFAPFPHSSIMFRRDRFDEVGGYRPQAEFWEDLDLYYRLSAIGRILVVPRELTSIRQSLASSRLRTDAFEVYRSIDTMYRAAASFERGGMQAAISCSRPSATDRLDPFSFVARGSVRLWSGRRPGILIPMLRRANLRLSVRTGLAVTWAALGAISPSLLRVGIRTLVGLRNWQTRSLLDRADAIEWRPRSSGPSFPSPAGTAPNRSQTAPARQGRLPDHAAMHPRANVDVSDE
jgi:glycosyltransferase involved in cell wall biosynthesis